jgi:TPR repeat protein
VPQDFAVAASWYRKAADQGACLSQGALGLMYKEGQGVPQDYVQAYMWLTLAASHCDASEKGLIDAAGAERDKLAAKMTPAQAAEAQRLAHEWKPKLAP